MSVQLAEASPFGASPPGDELPPPPPRWRPTAAQVPPEQRRARIIAYVHNRAARGPVPLSLEQLARVNRCAEQTARRDRDELVAQGHLVVAEQGGGWLRPGQRRASTYQLGPVPLRVWHPIHQGFGTPVVKTTHHLVGGRLQGVGGGRQSPNMRSETARPRGPAPGPVPFVRSPRPVTRYKPGPIPNNRPAVTGSWRQVLAPGKRV